MRRPLAETLAEALHASCCCDEPHTPGEIFIDMADRILEMVSEGADPTDRSSGQCPFCGTSMAMHSDSGHMFRCGWQALRRAKEISDA